jgi:hypothetical protein
MEQSQHQNKTPVQVVNRFLSANDTVYAFYRAREDAQNKSEVECAKGMTANIMERQESDLETRVTSSGFYSCTAGTNA